MSITGTRDFSIDVLSTTVDHDPTVVATDAPKGSLIIDANGVWYRKLDDGATTNVEIIGVGGTVSKAIDHNWTGDGTADRKIDLGDDYDLLFVYPASVFGSGQSHFAGGAAFRETWPAYIEIGGGAWERMSSQYGAWFQGKLSGADVNKIGLGFTAASPYTANVSGKPYRLVGIKFSSMV